MSPALVRDFDEGIASHVLNAFVSLVHEFEELIDNGFQKFPMRTQKPRILSDDVHNIRRDNRFVVLPPFLFAQSQ